MKKAFMITGILLLVLALLAAGLLYFRSMQPNIEETEPATEPTVVETEPEPTEPEPTEPPTEPEPTEPPFVIETEESWNQELYGRKVSAREYFVYDLDADKFLTRTGEPEQTLYPASITKLFSAYVALQHMEAKELVTVGSEITLIDVDSSVAELRQEDVLTLEQLIAGMLLPSGNDAAQTVAVAVGRKLAEDPQLNVWAASDRFVKQMNEDAQALGMTGSHFVTVDGIHAYDHYISMQDMVTIGRLALENEVIARCAAAATRTVVLSEERSLTWENTNELMQEDSGYYCLYVTGLKTGFTTPAGYCLLSSVNVDGRDLLIGVFGCKEPEDRFADTLLLFMRTFHLPVEAPVGTEPAPTQ